MRVKHGFATNCMFAIQGVQKFGQTKLQFAVGRDCIQKHFSKYEIEKNAFLVPEM